MLILTIRNIFFKMALYFTIPILKLEKVKFSPETDPEIQEITRVFQNKGYKWLEQKVTYAGIKHR